MNWKLILNLPLLWLLIPVAENFLSPNNVLVCALLISLACAYFVQKNVHSKYFLTDFLPALPAVYWLHVLM
jgi:hypothetical protein